MAEALSDYQEDLWWDCQRPFFDDEIDYDEFDKRMRELEARWRVEIGQRVRKAVGESIQSEELQSPRRP
jgi:hypothetical protein